MAGFIRKRNLIRDQVNNGESIDFESLSSDYHTVADLLKLYLRELPEPLVPTALFKAYSQMVESNENCASSVSIITRLVDTALPPIYYNMLKYICLFLNDVAIFHDYNEMNVNNLAIIFAPNLLQLGALLDVSQSSAMKWAKTEVLFVRHLIEHAEFIFCLPYQVPVRSLLAKREERRISVHYNTPLDDDWLEVFRPLNELKYEVKKAYKPCRDFITNSAFKHARVAASQEPNVKIGEGKNDAKVNVEKSDKSDKVDVVEKALDKDEETEKQISADPKTLVRTLSTQLNLTESKLDQLQSDLSGCRNGQLKFLV